MSRQDWRTPPSVFAQLSRDFGPFTLDAAATVDDALCDVWFSPTNSALSDDARWHGRFFVNIPFGGPMPWVKKAATETAFNPHCRGGIMLCQGGLSSEWFHFAIQHAELHVPDRRLQYWHPDECPWGVNKHGKVFARSFDRDSIVLVFEKTMTFVPVIRSLHVEPHHEEIRQLWAKANGVIPEAYLANLTAMRKAVV